MITRLSFAWHLLTWIISNIRIFLLPKTNENIQIITASDNTHQKSLYNLLTSITQFEPSASVIVFDLGIDSEFLAILRESFPFIKFRRFPFEDYPSYYNIKLDAGAYAWKPAAIELAKPWEETVLWLDAGNLLTGRLTFLRKTMKKYKFFSPFSIGTVEEWTHPAVISSLEIELVTLKSRNLAANVICFISSDKRASRLIENWINSSKDKELIAPEGSSRSNHRQDQSLLTLLAYKEGLVTFGNLARFPRRIFKILVHQDVD